MSTPPNAPTVLILQHDDVSLVEQPRRRERAGPDEAPWRDGDDVLHDVGNALTAALAYTQQLRLDPSACVSPRELKALRAIETNVIHAAKLLTRQAVSGPAADCDVLALIREAVAQVPPQRAGDVVVQWPGEICVTALGDPLAVARILTNLLDNAAKYSWPGTLIELALPPVDAGVEIVVRDRGIGVPEAKLEAIFAGHRTAEAQGMAPGQGLGLRSSRWLAEDLGGHLWATNNADGATEFHLWLPAPQKRAPLSPGMSAGPDAGAHSPPLNHVSNAGHRPREERHG